STVQFRVRATDARGAVGAFAQGPQVSPTLVQQTAASLSGRWTTVTSSDASGGSTYQSKVAGATATFTFTGTQIAWVGTTAPNAGRAQVILDGLSQGYVDLYSASLTRRRILFSKNVTSGSHTLVIKVYGNAGYVDVDAFVTGR
ncbi:MAG TPA: hypothetical protein VMZ00_08480, partial [Sporichthya sp.]|nr:hypothetical protein [Sporichthya sp.]